MKRIWKYACLILAISCFVGLGISIEQYNEVKDGRVLLMDEPFQTTLNTNPARASAFSWIVLSGMGIAFLAIGVTGFCMEEVKKHEYENYLSHESPQ